MTIQGFILWLYIIMGIFVVVAITSFYLVIKTMLKYWKLNKQGEELVREMNNMSEEQEDEYIRRRINNIIVKKGKN